MEQLRLSPSKLAEFKECPRCFWDTYAGGIKKPRGKFPSLPGGMDRAFKKYFDMYRGSMPSVLKGQIGGALMDDQALLNRWRHWRTGMTYKDNENDVVLIGAIDDCVVEEGVYVPLDYKTKGSAPKDSGVQYYQTQLDCYNLMLASEGYKTKDEGYIVYFYPVDISNLAGHVPEMIMTKFGIEVFKIGCSIERAKDVIAKAAACLRGERPDPASDCENCQYITQHIARERGK